MLFLKKVTVQKKGGNFKDTYEHMRYHVRKSAFPRVQNATRILLLLRFSTFMKKLVSKRPSSTRNTTISDTFLWKTYKIETYKYSIFSPPLHMPTRFHSFILFHGHNGHSFTNRYEMRTFYICHTTWECGGRRSFDLRT